MKASVSAIVLCALAFEFALASPQNQHAGHMHKKIHYSSTAAPAPPPAATSAPPPAATSKAPSENGKCAGPSDPDGFCLHGFGGRTDPVPGATVDEYKGNVGSPHGSNMQIVDANAAHLYKYKTKFESTGSDTIIVIVWNKSGPDGRPNSGQFSPPALQFDLGPGHPKYVVFDENSQIAWCHDTGKRTPWGAYDCTFGEADFGNLSNGGWSGADVSSIQNTGGNNMDMTINCPNGEKSSNLANNYVSDAQPGGIGCNIAPGPVQLMCKLG